MSWSEWSSVNSGDMQGSGSLIGSDVGVGFDDELLRLKNELDAEILRSRDILNQHLAAEMDIGLTPDNIASPVVLPLKDDDSIGLLGEFSESQCTPKDATSAGSILSSMEEAQPESTSSSHEKTLFYIGSLSQLESSGQEEDISTTGLSTILDDLSESTTNLKTTDRDKTEGTTTIAQSEGIFTDDFEETQITKCSTHSEVLQEVNRTPLSKEQSSSIIEISSTSTDEATLLTEGIIQEEEEEPVILSEGIDIFSQNTTVPANDFEEIQTTVHSVPLEESPLLTEDTTPLIEVIDNSSSVPIIPTDDFEYSHSTKHSIPSRGEKTSQISEKTDLTNHFTEDFEETITTVHSSSTKHTRVTDDSDCDAKEPIIEDIPYSKSISMNPEQAKSESSKLEESFSSQFEETSIHKDLKEPEPSTHKSSSEFLVLDIPDEETEIKSLSEQPSLENIPHQPISADSSPRRKLSLSNPSCYSTPKNPTSSKWRGSMSPDTHFVSCLSNLTPYTTYNRSNTHVSSPVPPRRGMADLSYLEVLHSSRRRLDAIMDNLESSKTTRDTSCLSMSP